MKYLYVVAVSQKEAESLATDIGWDTRTEAGEHLKRVKAPPTDSFYASQYKVFKVVVQVSGK